VSGRLLLVLATATGVGALAALAALGSTTTSAADADGWTGWTGRVDSASVSDRAAMTPDDASAVALLARSAAASAALAYAGRAVTSNRAETVATDLVHVPARGTLAQVVGEPSTSARFAPDGRSGSFADDGRQLSLLRVNYRVLREADLDTTVAGRATDAVVAVDAEGVLAARYWLDHRNGLLLRKELVDPAGAVWSRAGFDTISFEPQPEAELPATTATAWSAPLDDAGLRAARQAGCACPDALPGGLTLLDSRRAEAGAVTTEPVVHQLFSDGLESVSLFSLDGSISADDAEGLRARGFTRTELDGRYAWVRGGTAESTTATVVWTCQGTVLTLVTDDAQAPLTTAAAILAALPPEAEPVDGSLGARIARGWHRLTGSSS
jgi:sigma-E factor negative regulatory protein RseB